MTKTVKFAAAFLSLSAFACDKPTDAQPKADQAQVEANEKIAAAKKDEAQKISAAQAEADRKTDDIRASFAKTVETYRHETQTGLTDLDRKIDTIDARAKAATGHAKKEMDAKLPSIRAKRAAFGADLRSIDVAAATNWDATKARLDTEWTALKALVEGVS